MIRRRSSLPALVALVLASRASAEEVPLRELPVDKVTAMAPLLRHGEIALIESQPNGLMKQVTVISLVAAPPKMVRDLLATPERYKDFVEHLTRSEVDRKPDGTVDFHFGIDLKVVDLDANNRIKSLPDGGLYFTALNPTDRTTYRFQFYGVPGGTIMVQYGYTEVLRSNKFIQRLVTATPTLEHGLALSLQLFYIRSLKAYAERTATPGSFPEADRAARGPGFKFLLERGRVAVIRSSPDGRLADISILDTIYAPRAKVEEVVMNPRDYRSFIDGMKKSYEVKRNPAGDVEYESEFDLSIFTWTSRFLLHRDGAAIDHVGLSGDLRGAHCRWDLSSTGPKETQIIYRANQNLKAASPMILGAVFKEQPLFEHGMSVAIGLLNVVGVRGRAEGWR